MRRGSLALAELSVRVSACRSLCMESSVTLCQRREQDAWVTVSKAVNLAESQFDPVFLER